MFLTYNIDVLTKKKKKRYECMGMQQKNKRLFCFHMIFLQPIGGGGGGGGGEIENLSGKPFAILSGRVKIKTSVINT